MENVEMLIKNVTRKYEVKNNENVYALNNINMNLENGFIVLLGISGSGKSTLLNMISGLAMNVYQIIIKRSGIIID